MHQTKIQASTFPPKKDTHTHTHARTESRGAVLGHLPYHLKAPFRLFGARAYSSHGASKRSQVPRAQGVRPKRNPTGGPKLNRRGATGGFGPCVSTWGYRLFELSHSRLKLPGNRKLRSHKKWKEPTHGEAAEPVVFLGQRNYGETLNGPISLHLDIEEKK